MNFSKAEIEVLALCALCKDLPVNGCRNIPQEILSVLKFLGLIRPSRSRKGYRITPQGAELLTLAEMDYIQDKSYVSDTDKIARRMQTAEITSFFWRYGADVFREAQPAEKSQKVFLPSFTLRRQPVANILGGSRLTGFYYTPETVFIPYFITKENKGFYPNVEQRTFYAETLSLKRKPHVIYTGDGNLEDIIVAMKTHNPKPKKNTSVYFDDGIENIVCPVSILPLDENGMRQLRIMEVPNYKQRIVKTILEKNYLPPQMIEYDGRDKAEHYAIGIDCNIKRFEGFIRNKIPTRLFVLPFQAETVQKIVEGSKISCYVLDTADTEKALGISEQLPTVDNTPYKTEKGKYLNVPLIGKIKSSGG